MSYVLSASRGARTILGFGLALAAVAAIPASAQTESFETGLTPPAIQYGPDQFAAHNSNAVGPVALAGFNFSGYSGVITNGASGVFNASPDGNQTAFLQGYQGDGGSIDWTLSLAPGNYKLSFIAAGSLVVPAQMFSVSAFGSAPTWITPASTSYATYVVPFTVSSVVPGTITFFGPANAGNVASALDSLSITAVPESATWVMMILGFGVAGAAMRRRKSAANIAAFA